MNTSKTKVLSEFHKSAGELVRVSLSEYRGKRYIDLRIYFDGGQGEAADWNPSKRGLCIGVDLLAELKEAIDKAAEEYEKELFGLGEKGRDNGQTDQKDSGACMNGGGHAQNQDPKARAVREGQGGGSTDG